MGHFPRLILAALAVVAAGTASAQDTCTVGQWLYAWNNRAPNESNWKSTPEEAISQWRSTDHPYPPYSGNADLACNQAQSPPYGQTCVGPLKACTHNPGYPGATTTFMTCTHDVYVVDANGTETLTGVDGHAPIAYGTNTLTTAGSQYMDNCPAVADCLATQGQEHGVISVNQPHATPPPEYICGDGCEHYRVDLNNLNMWTTEDQRPYSAVDNGDGTEDRIVYYRRSGVSCQAGQPTPNPSDVYAPEDGEVCVGPWCTSQNAQKGCGFFNGQYVCPPSTEPDRCFRMADGSTLCAEGAPTPPRPDSGTAGVPATPDEVMEQCTGPNSCNTYNYYNPTTTSGSNRPVPDGTGTGGEGLVDGDGAVLDGEGDDPTADDSASGGLACDAPPTCDGDPIACAQLQQQWRIRCVEAPTDAEALSAIGATDAEKGIGAGPNDGTVSLPSSLPTGGFISGSSCPTAGNITVMGETISLDDFWLRACEMAILFAPIVQAMGALFAALILFRSNFG